MGPKNKFDFLFKEFIYGGHLQCLGASSIIFITAFVLKLNIRLDALIVAYLLFYPLYLYNRWKEIEIDYTTNPERTKYLKTYIKYMPFIFASVILILIIFLFLFGNFTSFALGMILLVLGLMYTTVFKKVTRKIILFKNFYVASFFTLLVFFTAIYHSLPLIKSPIIVPLAILMLFVFGKAFLMQIFLDLKDVESDKKEGLKTLGVLIGRDKTFKVLKILSILTTVPVIVIFSLFVPLFPKSVLMLIFTVFYNFYSFKIAKDKNYFGYILGSGEFVLWTILILSGEILI
ncbi:MAG: UbiA family prenyltransferase [bacterium]|nr:UbiA family prenyltransferase [bacterium]